MLLPAFFAYAFGGDRARLLGRTALFYLGLLLTLVPLGLGAGALGSLLTVHRDTLSIVGGIVLIVFGLITALGIRIPIPGLKQRGDPRSALGPSSSERPTASRVPAPARCWAPS
nr:cytochrome c biogenesis protein CcdA [Tessaracoccus coleopterorum]